VIQLFPQDFSGDAQNLKLSGDEQEGRSKTAFFDTSRFKNALPDFKFTSIETTLKDTVRNFKDLKLL
jgi:hypothetical protein